MEAYLIGYDGRQYLLPALLRWKFSYGAALPCDAFELSFLYDTSMAEMLEAGRRLRAVHEGKTVFSGLVDEAEISVTQEGGLVNLSGRGLAALLLDNEAEAAEYFSLSLEMLLERYVYPLGLREIRRNVSVPPQALVVDSGSSIWRVLEDFLWFGSGVRPRFSPDGVLIIGGEKGRRLAVDGGTAVLERRLKRTRYGVVSEVLVKNKALGTTEIVRDEDFVRQGGQCRRVVNVPRKTRFDAMRATGEYQLARSRAQAFSLRLTLPGLFAAFPGDWIALSDCGAGFDGGYFVSRATCFADGETAGTEIVLTETGI